MKKIILVQTAVLVAFGLAIMAVQAAPSSSLATGHHKLQVRDRGLGSQLAAAGASLIADYGGYQLFDAPDSMTNLAPDKATLRDDYNIIRLNTGSLDTTKTEVKALRKSVGAFTGKRLHMVHFAGPVQPAWKQSLLDAGAQIVCYIPQNTYLVYGDAPGIARIQAMAAGAPHFQWEGPYADEYKTHPSAKPDKFKGDQFSIQLVSDTDANASTLKLLDQLKLTPIVRQHHILNFVNVVARVSPANLAQLAARPDVVSIQPYVTPHKVCERQDQIVAGNLSGNSPSGPGYLTWLQNHGFTQTKTTFAVDVSDSGIDDGTTHPNHFGLYVDGLPTMASRVIYNRLEGTPNPGSTLVGCDGHGNINAHIVCGYDNYDNKSSGTQVFEDGSGYHFGLGVCPFAEVGSSVIFDPTNFTSPSYEDLMSQAYESGARISNNSWGDSGDGSGASPEDGIYTTDSQEYDALVRDAQPTGSTYPAPGNQEMVIVFAAGNDGQYGLGTISAPGTAKNVIAVGAADNVQPFGGANNGADFGGVDDSQADDANSMANFSGAGPCADGRQKPDIVAPGTHVSGGVSQAGSPGPEGTAEQCFIDISTNEIGVDGGPDGSRFFPDDGQEFYTASSGTSHATPCVSGGCALVRQYFINQGWTNPSPAMTKAWLMNSARYMTGDLADDNLWSPEQGMGEMNLGTAFDGVSRFIRDEAPGDMFTASGQTRVFAGTVANANEPFRVTVAWTDAPGNTTGDAYNNDLDLVVTVGGNTYLGNNFSGSTSVTGGSPDPRNNVESVFLPAGVSGPFTVTINGTSINSVGVPGAAGVVNQDFALVVYNAAVAPVIVPAGSVLTRESCTPTNGVIDPGEIVAVNFSFQNAGSVGTSDLVATLLTSNGVVSPSSPQTFGAVAAGAEATAAFSFQAEGDCGGTVGAVFQLQDGSTNLGTATFYFQLGQLITSTNFSQNFDSTTAPNLPGGWSTSDLFQEEGESAQAAWTTTSGLSFSPHNSVFCPDSAFVDEVFLTSPSITLPGGPCQLTFQQSFNLEDYYDGGVLLININNGGFEDIVSAGGSFVMGSYSGTITDVGDRRQERSPFYGDNSWTGTTDGFMNTVVNLPSSAQGQTVQFQWACGTDYGNYNLVGAGGWWIDNIAIIQTNWSCCSSVPNYTTAITSPTNGQISTVSTIQVSGTSQPNAQVVLTDSGNSIAIVTADAFGDFSTSITVNGGGNVLLATESGTTNASSPVTVYFQPVAPTLTVASYSTTNVAVSGSGLAGAVVNIMTNGVLAANFTNNGSGAYSGTVVLPVGIYFMSATETANGATSATSYSVSVTVLSVTAPTLVVSSFTTPSVVVSGSGIPNAVVNILTNDVPAAHVTVNGSGTYGYTITLPDGVYAVSATETLDDLTSSPSATNTVTVVTVTTPTLVVAAKSGPNVAVSGTGLAGAVVNLFANSVPAAQFPVSASGKYSGTVTLANGTYTMSVTETTNGLTSSASSTFSVTVVTITPPTILFPPNYFTTNTGSLTLKGAANAGTKVSAYANSNLVGTATVSSAGAFTLPVVLTNAFVQLTAIETSNGIASAASAPVTVLLTLAPVVRVNPQPITGFVKETVTFSAGAYGALPLRYSWLKNGVKIAGAATTNLTLANLTTNSADGYAMIAANNYGAVTTSVATLSLIPNPFTDLTGTYNGLFEQTNADFQSSGLLTLTLGSLGSFTGKILNDGGSYSFTGAFSVEGSALVPVSRGTGVTPLLLDMNLDLTTNEQILGIVSNAAWISGLQAYLAPWAATNPFPAHGNYTMLLGSDSDGSAGPGGSGYGSVSALTTGMVSWNGVLSDNTSVVVPAIGVSRDGLWPMYVPLYGKLGCLFGWVEFVGTNQFQSLSQADWFRVGASGTLYKAGFTNAVLTAGSIYKPGNSKTPVLLPTNNIELTLSGGGLTNALTDMLTLHDTGIFTTNSGDVSKLTLSVVPTSGIISGSFLDPVTRLTTTIRGAVLQQQGYAGGFFVGTNKTGVFQLAP